MGECVEMFVDWLVAGATAWDASGKVHEVTWSLNSSLRERLRE